MSADQASLAAVPDGQLVVGVLALDPGSLQ